MNASPHICAGNALPTEPSSQLSILDLRKFKNDSRNTIYDLLLYSK